MKPPLAWPLSWFAIVNLQIMVGLSFAAGPPSPEGLHTGAEVATHLETAAIDPLVVTAEGDATNRVGQPTFITIKVKNTTSTDLLVKNINVRIDRASADRFKDTSCELQQLGEIKLLRGLAFEQTCRFEMSEPNFSWGLKFWQDMLLAADVRLLVTANIEALGIYKYYPSVRVNAPELSIFAGGIFGALLLALFVWIERVLRNPEVRDAWVKNLGFTLLMGLRGGIMAVIALLIGKTTQGAGAPVSLTVVDFTGGVMVGLFSYPLASWISSALKLDNVLPLRVEGTSVVKSAQDGS